MDRGISGANIIAKTVVKFKFYEDKKWSRLYKEVNDQGEFIDNDFRANKIGSLYIKKDSEVGKEFPRNILVTVESADN